MAHSILPFVYAATCVAVIGFQMALIAGAPWGHLTQGGRYEGSLPTQGRVAAGGSIFLLAAMALAILSATGQWPHWPTWTGWAALGIQGLTTLMNWATPSIPERRLWGPTNTVMLALAVAVMLLL